VADRGDGAAAVEFERQPGGGQPGRRGRRVRGPQDFLDDWRERFRKRRDMVVQAVRAISGLSTPVPDGAFYCFVDATR
jgi:hypothetical protein